MVLMLKDVEVFVDTTTIGTRGSYGLLGGMKGLEDWVGGKLLEKFE